MNTERHVVMAWEAGSGIGHITTFVPLVKLFRTEGWRVTLVLQRLEQAERWFDPADVTLLLAPIHTGQILRRLKTVNTSSLLSEVGWLDDLTLQSQLRGWLSLLDALRPSLLLCEYAPVAMLAARFRQSVVTATIGGSISVPVLNTPMPPLRWWRNDPLEVATRHDTHILAVVNTVLKRENLPPLQAMKELWQTDENFLCTLPPLDYGAHMGQPRRCRGILKHTDGGTEPVWPGEGRERVFAYLRPGMAHFDVILQALKSLCLCSLIVAPGISAELEAQYSSGCLKISGLVNMSAVCGQASLIIGNGSLSITAQALQHGIPSFMSPVFLEHRMNAVGAYLSGASMMIEPNPTVEGVARQLERILLEPGFRKAAVACSQLPEVRRSAAEVAEEVTQQCIDLVEQKL